MLKLFPIITVSRARNVYKGKNLQDPSGACARRDVHLKRPAQIEKDFTYGVDTGALFHIQERFNSFT